MKVQNLVVLTGAGISQESGLKTFRGEDGLWEGYRIEEVATPQAWRRNPSMVQEFYNLRRKSVLEAQPNEAHYELKRLEQYFNVQIITQNIDDLHERAGSTNILHLHGIITKSQSSLNPKVTYEIKGWELKMGEKCEYGSQLRPHVVWFGEAVPMIEPAIELIMNADVVLVVGTSLQVYPAASLIHYRRKDTPLYLIDPNLNQVADAIVIQEKASIGMRTFSDIVLNKKGR